MKKIYLILIMGMFLISLVSAECSIETVEKGTTIDLYSSCTNCTQVNLTKVIDPDNQPILLGQFEMTANGSNYNFTFSDTNKLGTHVYYSEGDLNGIPISQPCSFEVTPDGNPIQIFPYQFALIFFAFLLIFLSYFNERLNLFRYMGSIMMMVLGVVTIYPGYSFLNWTTLSGKILGFSLIGLGFYFLIEDSFSRKEQAPRFDQDHSFKDSKIKEKKLFRGDGDND